MSLRTLIQIAMGGNLEFESFILFFFYKRRTNALNLNAYLHNNEHFILINHLDRKDESFLMTLLSYFKILLLTFKVLNGMAPAYISDLINVRKHARYSLLSNSGTVLFHPARKKNPLVRDRLV